MAPRTKARLRLLVGPLVLGAALVLSVGCQADSEEETRLADLAEVWPDVQGSLFLTQLDNGDLVAIDADTSAVVWRYRHFGVPRDEVIDLPRSRLVCEPKPVSSDLLYLVFTDWLVALSPKTATVRWRMRLHSPIPRGLCPAITPDSGVSMVVMRGRAAAKLSSDGTPLWTYWFPHDAVAVTGPLVLADSGDTLIRAGEDLFSLSPKGALNWKRPVFP